MNKIMKRSHSVQNIAWFVDLIDRGQIILNPPYQRKSVWSPSYKRFFIDTIMRDYPAPPIFLNQEIKPDGRTKYYVIDGRQRLESILMFAKNLIALPDDFGDEELNGKYFNELSEEHQKKFWSYCLSVEFYTDADSKLIKDSFDRLNRNVLKLTDQELRHAQFDGEFITLMTEISNDPFWEYIKINRQDTIKRMKNVEFISELFLLTMNGVESSSKNLLDKYYAEYDEEVPNKEEYRRTFEEVKQMIQKIGLDISKTRFFYYSDFYSLWGAVLKFINKDIDHEKTKEKLLLFLDELLNNKAKIDIIDYLEAVKSQPNNINKRKRRIEIISKYIVIK